MGDYCWKLAGVSKEEISISLSDDYLRISGNRSFCPDKHPGCYYNMEIETGNFERRDILPRYDNRQGQSQGNLYQWHPEDCLQDSGQDRTDYPIKLIRTSFASSG
jgi:hypothetical protein